MCSILDLTYWSARDWVFLSSAFGALGSLLLVKGIIFNKFSMEESSTFWGSNQYLALGSENRRAENILGLSYILLSFALQFISVFLPGRWNIEKCNLFFENRTWIVLVGFLMISLVSVVLPSFLVQRKFRIKNACEYFKGVEENIAEVNSGYLRIDLREKTDEERSKISNLDQCIESTKKQVSQRIVAIENLFNISGSGGSNLERLENIQKHLEKWCYASKR